jgi:hypothetical protein
MCEVNSADPRVELAVRQIVQLANIIETGRPLESHLFVPTLIVRHPEIIAPSAPDIIEHHRLGLRLVAKNIGLPFTTKYQNFEKKLH